MHGMRCVIFFQSTQNNFENWLGARRGTHTHKQIKFPGHVRLPPADIVHQFYIELSVSLRVEHCFKYSQRQLLFTNNI